MQRYIYLIIHHYAPDPSEADMQRSRENLELLRRSNFGSPSAVPSEDVFQELSASTGMEVEQIRALYAWTHGALTTELSARNLHFHANANNAKLVELVIANMLRVRAAAASGAQPSGAMSVGFSSGKRSSVLSGGDKISDRFIIDLSDETGMPASDVKNIT